MFLDALMPYNLRAFDNVAAPTMTTPVVFGTPGTTTYEYCATVETFVGETTESATVTVTNGPAVLNGIDRILLQVEEVLEAVRTVRFFRKVGGVWQLLGESTAAANGLYDEGQATTAVEPPTENTSGREGWLFLGVYTNRPLQRMELMDLQAMIHRMVRDLAATLHADGDIVEGGSEEDLGDNTWGFKAGAFVFEGRRIPFPAGEVTLVGTGEETAGIWMYTDVLTYEDDPLLRNVDEGVGPTYNLAGCDRIIVALEWGLSTDTPPVSRAGFVPIKVFVDGQPKLATLAIERTVLDRTLARRTYDMAGSFTTQPSPLDVEDYPTDDTQLVLVVRGGGKHYPNGYEVETKGDQRIPFAKARAVGSANNTGTDTFVMPGGTVIGTVAEPFNVDGLNVKLQVGSGNYHTVALTGTSQSAAQVAAQIAGAINAYPTAGTLIYGMAPSGYLQLQAIDGRSLTVAAVASDAYTVLGIATGTYEPSGQRIYPLNDDFIKTTTDVHYEADVVQSVVHDGNTHVDPLSTSTLLGIYGASATEADARDGKWDWQLAVDFVRDGNSISFAGVGGSEPSHGQTYFVAYKHNHNAVRGSRHLVRVVDAQIVKGAEDGQDTLVFTGATSITRVSTGEAVAGLSGNISDVVRILRVNNAVGQSTTEYTSYSLLKNSSALQHSSSQIDWSGAGAPGSGATGQPSTSQQYYCTLEFWHHAVEGDYVAADSFDLYAEIETFSTTNLRDCVDLRCSGGVLPNANENVILDYEYYLSRIDKIVLADTGTFALITGVAALDPPVPNDMEALYTIGIVRINPYTYSTDDLEIVHLETLRITQAGIRKLRDRIERLEYWKTVNDLEREVAEHPAAVDKVGVLTDALTGFQKFDLGFSTNGISHTAALDRLERCLLLPATSEGHELAVNLPACTHVKRLGNTISLDYTPKVFDEQPLATCYVNAASDFVYENYVGTIDLNPAVDVFLDQQQMPTVQHDFDNMLKSLVNGVNSGLAANALNWGGWTTKGEVKKGNTTTTSQTRTAKQQTIALMPGGQTVDLGNQVVDLSMVQMMRTTDKSGNPIVVRVRVQGLMPNQDHACTINGIAVDFVYDSGVTNARGQQGTATFRGKTTVKADNTGQLTGKFNMPAGVRSGTAPVQVFHATAGSASWAQAVFSSAGFLEKKQKNTIGLPSVVTRTQTQTQTRTTTTTLPTPTPIPEPGPDPPINFAQVDPLAQSFVARDQVRYYAVTGLFFRRKSATRPFGVECREMINGYPGPRVYATATVQPDDIVVSENGTAETLLWFPNVVGLDPDTEFCFVPMPGQTTEFELWACELGQIDVATGQQATTQMHEGVLFHSPNNRTWDPWTKKDLKFRLYESIFENDCQIAFDPVTGIEASNIIAAVEEFAAPGTSVQWAYSLDGVSWTPFDPDLNVTLGTIATEVRLRVDVTSFGGSYQMIEQVAGIMLLLHEASANAVWTEEIFADDLNYPNRVVCIMDLDCDGTNGQGVTSITPYYSVDGGETWVALTVPADYTAVAQEDPYWRWQFETPGQVTVTGATNASPIVITSTNHGHQENEIAVIAGVGGNTAANGTWRLKNVTTDTAELYDPTTDLPVAGNGAYADSGTMDVAEFSRMRPRCKFETSNQARTPRVQNVGFVCSRV